MIRNNTKPTPILRKTRRLKKQPSLKTNPSTKQSPDMRLEDDSLSPKRRNSLKFAAPTKMIIIDPKSEYCKTVWCAIGVALTNVAIGAVLMTILHYSIRTKDAHAIICAIALHFFAAEAILAMHYANGWSSPMRARHRKFAHIFLQICGIILLIIGTVVALLRDKFDTSTLEDPHVITGILTTILVILTAFIGPFAYFTRKKWAMIMHLTLGIITFIMSALCVCFGLILKAFKLWAGQTVVLILIACVIFYLIFIVTGSFMKCVSRLI